MERDLNIIPFSSIIANLLIEKREVRLVEIALALNELYSKYPEYNVSEINDDALIELYKYTDFDKYRIRLKNNLNHSSIITNKAGRTLTLKKWLVEHSYTYILENKKKEEIKVETEQNFIKSITKKLTKTLKKIISLN